MTKLPFAYLDECVDYRLVEALRKRGFLVTAVFDEGTEGLTDEEQLSYAAKRGWILVTHNERHFWSLHQRRQPHCGIIVLPQNPPLRRLEVRAAMMLAWIAALDDRSKFFKWGQLQEILEQGYCPPGFSTADVSFGLGQRER